VVNSNQLILHCTIFAVSKGVLLRQFYVGYIKNFLMINWSLMIVWKCLFHFAAFITIIAGAVALVPVPLPRRRRHERRVMNGVIQRDVSPVPDSNQRSVGWLDSFV